MPSADSRSSAATLYVSLFTGAHHRLPAPAAARRGPEPRRRCRSALAVAGAAVTEPTIRTALVGGFRDFEDAVCHAAALEAHAELIVTSNLADFAAGAVPAVLPETLLAAEAG